MCDAMYLATLRRYNSPVAKTPSRVMFETVQMLVCVASPCRKVKGAKAIRVLRLARRPPVQKAKKRFGLFCSQIGRHEVMIDCAFNLSAWEITEALRLEAVRLHVVCHVCIR